MKKKREMIEIEWTWWEKVLKGIGWYRLEKWIEDWIYPGYNLRNLLYNRYDLIKVKTMKRYEYAEPDYRLYHGNMGIIVSFIEKGEPEKYICWYKDENGDDIGRKYGDYKNEVMVFEKEYRGKYIMDIIKEIYKWYKEEEPLLQKEHDYLQEFAIYNVIGVMKDKYNKEQDVYEVYWDKSELPQTIEEIDASDLEWDILNKYFKDKKDILNEEKIREVYWQIQEEILKKQQKYMILIAAIRPYLWT